MERAFLYYINEDNEDGDDGILISMSRADRPPLPLEKRALANQEQKKKAED